MQNTKPKQIHKTKPKYIKLNLNQHSPVRTAHVCVCVYHCAQVSYTTQHRTVLIIFSHILQTVIIAQMTYTGTGMTINDWLSRFNVPLKTLQVISWTGFYGSNDPTDSVKTLKEVVVLRIGFNPTRPTSQWDKTHSRELLGPFMCVHCSVHNCCTQYCTGQTW